ncbi:MAG: tRNA-dihydrouridine synthase family protein [Verrucomicrobiota bacterium]
MQEHFPTGRPVLVLAPMQDVTDLPFWRLLHHYGDPDIYFTEYLRVHPVSRPEKPILRCIEANPSDKPVIAQMIGQDIPALVRTARELARHRIAAVDLNLGCPAPIVCKKDAGGGLLRNPEKIDAILGALRTSLTDTHFTVKTRLGFDSIAEFDRVLEVFRRHAIDLLTVHGRTVREMYRAAVHYDCIADAVRALPCPVIANGNVLSTRLARETIRRTGAAGLMIGRGCIRNPWIFRQIKEAYANADAAGATNSPEWEAAFAPDFRPALRDVLGYLERLWEETSLPGRPPERHVAKMKKYLNFIAQGVGGPEQPLLKQIRRAPDADTFWRVAREHLDSGEPFDPEPPTAALIDERSQRAVQAEREAALAK